MRHRKGQRRSQVRKGHQDRRNLTGTGDICLHRNIYRYRHQRSSTALCKPRTQPPLLHAHAHLHPLNISPSTPPDSTRIHTPSMPMTGPIHDRMGRQIPGADGGRPHANVEHPHSHLCSGVGPHSHIRYAHLHLHYQQPTYSTQDDGGWSLCRLQGGDVTGVDVGQTEGRRTSLHGR